MHTHNKYSELQPLAGLLKITHRNTPIQHWFTLVIILMHTDTARCVWPIKRQTGSNWFQVRLRMRFHIKEPKDNLIFSMESLTIRPGTPSWQWLCKGMHVFRMSPCNGSRFSDPHTLALLQKLAYSMWCLCNLRGGDFYWWCCSFLFSRKITQENSKYRTKKSHWKR